MSSMQLEKACFFLFAAAACAVLGCGSGGPATVPVSGTVTLDGTPLEGAAVSFSPVGEGRQATGQTDSAGKFTLTSYKPGDGAPVGKYKVGISKLEAKADRQGDPNKSGLVPAGTQLSGPPVKGPAAQPKALVPVKYLNPTTSGFDIEVKAGMGPVELKMTSN